MSPSDLPSLEFAVRRSALRLAIVLLFCFRCGIRWLLPDLAILRPTFFSPPEFDYLIHGLGPGIPKKEVYSGVGS